MPVSGIGDGRLRVRRPGGDTSNPHACGIAFDSLRNDEVEHGIVFIAGIGDARGSRFRAGRDGSDLDRGTESARTDDQRERVAPFLSDRRIPKPVKSGSLRDFHLFFRCGFLAGLLVCDGHFPGRREGIPDGTVIGKLNFQFCGEKRPDLSGGIVSVRNRNGGARPRVTPTVADADVELDQESRSGLADFESGKFTAEVPAFHRPKSGNQFLRIGFRQRNMDFISGNGDSFCNPDLRRGCGVPVVRDHEIPGGVGGEISIKRFHFCIKEF